VQKGWVGMATVDAVRSAAGVLVDCDFLRLEVAASNGGRPSERYRVTPWLRKKLGPA